MRQFTLAFQNICERDFRLRHFMATQMPEAMLADIDEAQLVAPEPDVANADVAHADVVDLEIQNA